MIYFEVNLAFESQVYYLLLLFGILAKEFQIAKGMRQKILYTPAKCITKCVFNVLSFHCNNVLRIQFFRNKRNVYLDAIDLIF